MAVDLNDPSTWPETVDDLAALASGLVEAEEPKAEEPKAEEPKAEEPKAEEPKAEETLPPRDDQGRFTKVEDQDAPVLTADGKHYIPHSVLKDARDRARQAEQTAQERDQQLQDLQRQLAELKTAQTSAAGPATMPKTPAADVLQTLLDQAVTLTEADEAKVDKYRQEWGDEPSEVFRQTLLATRRTEHQTEVLRAQHLALMEQQKLTAELKAQLERTAQSARETEGEQIQAAIDQSPLLTAWQADQKSPYFDYSVKLHQHLMETNPAYAKASWSDRMASLPAKVEALYGRSPHSDQVGAVGAPAASAAPVTSVAPAARVPASLTDIAASGQPPAVSALEAVERMSPAQLQQHLVSMTPDQLKEYLYQFSR